MRILFAFASIGLAACSGTHDGADPSSFDEEIDDYGGKSDAVTTGSATRYPIVLVHGVNASPTYFGFKREVVDALCRDGHAVYDPALPPYQPVTKRSQVLAQVVSQILDGSLASDCPGAVAPAVPPEKINIIAHSMGGLDARYLASTLGYGDRIASILTVSTPHRGSAMADMVVGLLEQAGGNQDAINAFAQFLARQVTRDELLTDSDLLGAMRSITEAESVDFNANNPDQDGIYYQSWAGLSNVAGISNPLDTAACEGKRSSRIHVMHISLKPIAAVVAHGVALRPNDALVMVESAKWGDFRGCIPADHADEVGAFANSWSPFDHVRFYRKRAFELSSYGF
jgi:triacylglycerol lipase